MISDRDNILLNSFGKPAGNNIMSFEEAINSFMPKNEPNIGKDTSFNIPIFNNDSVGKDVNCKESKAFSIRSGLVETRDKSSYGSSGEILFSGYFGQKADDETFNGHHFFNKNATCTNPFPMIEEEKPQNYSNISFTTSMSRQSLKRQKGDSFNSNSTNRNYFTELVKSVSLGNLRKKKSNIKLTISTFFRRARAAED
jgi:hypothetical protein